MIKALKLQKALIAIALGVITLVIAQIMINNKVNGSNYMLGLSGFLLIIGAIIFLYPILFAKKIDPDGKRVELQPVEKDNLTEVREPESM